MCWIHVVVQDSLTPLHCAARSGHDRVVDLLLEKGAEVTAKTKNGLTALHMAAQGDHVDSARVLHFHNAPVDDVTMVRTAVLCWSVFILFWIFKVCYSVFHDLWTCFSEDFSWIIVIPYQSVYLVDMTCFYMHL